MLTPVERALLFRACWDHPVARCPRCAVSFRKVELAAELFAGRSDLCPSCRTDLTDSIREHLISCAMAARLDAQDARTEARALRESSAAIRAESEAILETNAAILKDAQRICDAAQIARAESEAERRKRAEGKKPPPQA